MLKTRWFLTNLGAIAEMILEEVALPTYLQERDFSA